MKYFVAILLSACVTVALAQKQKKGEKNDKKETTATPETPAVTPATPEQKSEPQAQPRLAPMTQHFLRKYSLAAQWNDFEVAKSALYDLIVENPANDSLLFTLAYYYYENRQYASNLLISQELLARSPKNLGYLEMAAVSGEALGVKDKALQYYETLYLLSNSLETLYKISFLQYELKRYKESQTNIDILLAKPEIATTKVYFNDNTGKAKEYTMKVAILNLKGMVLQEQGDKAGARKLYQEALAISPDFTFAKENLAKLK